MLNEKDVSMLQKMFACQEERYGKDVRELHQRIVELEQKMFGELHAVRDDVIDILNTGLIPQFDRFDARITRLERRVAMIP